MSAQCLCNAHYLARLVTKGDGTHPFFKSAKEAWNKLTSLYIGNASIQESKYEEVSNEADNFHMLESETAEEMFRRLTALGCQHPDF